MATPTKKTKIKLDKVRHLRYTNRALIELEEVTGLTIGQAARQLQLGSLSTCRDMVWAGLLHESPDLTRDEAADLIDLERLEEIAEAVAEAFDIALGEPSKNGDEGKAEPAS